MITVAMNGASPTVVTGNTTFNFPAAVASAGSYAVTVAAQPVEQQCQVTNGTGSGVVADVSNVNIVCSVPVPTMLYAFDGGSTGSSSAYELILGSDGNFYGIEGATSSGTAGGGANGVGAIFRITAAGVKTVLYSFKGGTADGSSPMSVISANDGNLYGTTYSGGTYGSGTVFKISLAGGQETVLHSFGATPTDGAKPNNPGSSSNFILGADGNLYGTTFAGGTYGAGTVFKITPAGVETVFYSINGTTDGRYPVSLVSDPAGNFYVLTQAGATNSQGGILKLSSAGAPTNLYSFPANPNTSGDLPLSLTFGNDGAVYGVTLYGGTFNAGTVFKLTAGGVATVLYNFSGGADGAHPTSVILGKDGNIYGATSSIYPSGGPVNYSMLFEITPAGAETVLYSFPASYGDYNLVSQLVIGRDGYLYGVTSNGGNITATSIGNGTFFKF